MRPDQQKGSEGKRGGGIMDRPLKSIGTTSFGPMPEPKTQKGEWGKEKSRRK